MTHEPSTWHHGLVADYWATVNLDAPELDLYRQYLVSPVLDAGCGAGRLLAPLRAAGFDVDGCDASADMVERCRQRAPEATLWVSPLHELAPPRRYASIVCSGVLGLGSTREQDVRALTRLHDALLPGGTLVLDNDEQPFDWHVRDWNEPSGGELSLRSRVDAVDEADRCVHMTIRAEARDGRREEHALTMRFWRREELVPLLHGAGFAQIDVRQGVDEHTLVYVARTGHGFDFEQAVDQALDTLPPDLRRAMTNVSIVVEREPPQGMPLLGLYHGIPLTERTGSYSGVLPDRISIYSGPLERTWGHDRALLEQQTRRVVLHEIAHHFGISDERLHELDRY